MEIWSEIRRDVLTGALSQRAAIAKYGIGWHTLKKMLAHDEPPGYRQANQRPKPKLERFLPVIRQVLEDKRILVTCWKMRGHEGRETRWTPLFPELRRELEEWRKEAPVDREFVLKPAVSPKTNLRTGLIKILKRAGIKPWPKLYQTQLGGRHSCESAEDPGEMALRREVRGVISASPDHEGLALAPPRRER
jgi:hypothetical protein